MGDIIDAVQVTGANLIKHVLTPSALDFQGLIPIEQLTGFAAGKYLEKKENNQIEL